MSTDPAFYETLNALNGSINKWSNIVAGTGTDKLSRNCALCKLFLEATSTQDKQCGGCPVAIKAGVTGCHNTPFEDWNDHQNTVHRDCAITRRYVHVGCAECTRLAQAELDFLRSLLPANGYSAAEQGATR